MDEKRRAMAQKLLNAFIQFSRSDWHREPIKELGYRPSEVVLMFCIMRVGAPGMKVSEISNELRVTSPTVTQLVKGLEARGVVERIPDPVDRRAVCIKLTEKGEDVARHASDSFFASFGDLVEYMGEKESRQLADLLSKVSSYFHGKKDSPWIPEAQGHEGDVQA